jgi:hypothetical protein
MGEYQEQTLLVKQQMMNADSLFRAGNYGMMFPHILSNTEGQQAG